MNEVNNNMNQANTNNNMNELNNNINEVNNNINTVNNNFKERDEIDTYFSDAKKKSFPIGIVFFLLILVILGGCAYYYFVIDSPKNIFLTAINNKLSNIKLDDYEKVSIDFELDTNMMTTDKELVDTFNILNKISLTGNISEDLNNKTAYLKLNALYEEEDLLGMDMYYEKNTVYLKLNNLYDKVIKSDLTEEEISDMNDSFENYDKELQNKLVSSLKKNITETLKNANYTKEYVELNETYVKKLNLIIDDNLLKDFYNKLLNDDDFIESYSKLVEITESELKEQLEDEIDNIDPDYKLTISLYLSILKNEFTMLELINEDSRIVINKENDEYNYKCYELDIIKFQGYASLVKNNEKEYELFFSLDAIEEQLNIEFNLDLSYEYDLEIDKLDTSNAKNVDDLTDEDINKILTNITNNKNLNKLITDINALMPETTTETEDYLM